MSGKKINTLIIMFIVSFASKGLALVRSMIFANYFGTGDDATAFFTASNISLQFMEIFMLSVIGAIFIPVYTRIEEENGRENALKFSNNFMNIIFVISVVIAILGIIFSSYIVKVIAPGLDSSVYLLTVDLVKILFPSVMFGALAYVCVAFLQSNDEFNIPNLISAVFNIVIIAYLLIFGVDYGVYGVIIAMLIGWGFQFFIQIPSVIKHKYKFKLSVNFKDKNIIDAFKMAIPIMLVSIINPISSIINVAIASNIDSGYAIPAIEYSHYLYISVAAIFSHTICSLIFPSLSKLNVKKSLGELKNLVSKVLDFIMLYSIPISMIFIVCGRQIIKILYERGEFTSYSTTVTSGVLVIYCLAIMGYGINEIMNKCFYSMSKTKIPFITGVISIVINIILSIILSNYIGVNGIPLAYVISTFTNSVLLIIIFSKKIKIINFYLCSQLFKNIISASIMGVSMYFLANMLGGYSGSLILEFMVLCLECLVGIIVFISINILLKNKMVIELLRMLWLKVKTN